MALDGSGSVSLACFSVPAGSSPPRCGLLQWVGEGQGLVGGMQVRLWPLSTSCPGSSMAALLLGYTAGSCLSWETGAGHQVPLCPDRRRGGESTLRQKAPICLPSRSKKPAAAASRKPFWEEWSLFWASELISCLGQWPMKVQRLQPLRPCRRARGARTGGHPEDSEFTCSHQQARKPCKMRLGPQAPEPRRPCSAFPPVMNIHSPRHNLNK